MDTILMSSEFCIYPSWKPRDSNRNGVLLTPVVSLAWKHECFCGLKVTITMMLMMMLILALVQLAVHVPAEHSAGREAFRPEQHVSSLALDILV